MRGLLKNKVSYDQASPVSVEQLANRLACVNSLVRWPSGAKQPSIFQEDVRYDCPLVALQPFRCEVHDTKDAVIEMT